MNEANFCLKTVPLLGADSIATVSIRGSEKDITAMIALTAMNNKQVAFLLTTAFCLYVASSEDPEGLTEVCIEAIQKAEKIRK